VEKTEQELIGRARRGSSEAFEQLMLAHQRTVYNLCLYMVKDPEEAMDLSQETFLKAWKGLKSFEGKSSFSTWLHRIANNVCIDYLRKRKNEKVIPLTLEDGDGDEMTLELPDPSPLTEELAERGDLRAVIEEGLQSLTADHRSILILREIDLMSYEEIAAVLEISVGTVKSRISRARRELCHSLLSSGNFLFPDASKEAEGK